jgi:hypothetical protein
MFVFRPNLCSHSSCPSTLQSSLGRILNISPPLTGATYYAWEPRNRIFSHGLYYTSPEGLHIVLPMHFDLRAFYNTEIGCCCVSASLTFFGGGGHGGRLLWYSSSRAGLSLYRSLCHLQAKVVEEALPVDDGLFLPRIYSSWDSHNASIFSSFRILVRTLFTLSEEPSYTLHLRLGVPTRQTVMGCIADPLSRDSSRRASCPKRFDIQ